VAVAAAASASAIASGTAVSSSSSREATPVRVAYLSFAVANSYDAPMLAAAKAVASKQNASVTVFDAANDPKKQFAQFQTTATSRQFDVIVVQPIFGTGLFPVVRLALKNKVKVVNMDQILGPNFSTLKAQIAGLSGNIVDHVPTNIGVGLGKLAVSGCKAKRLNPCNIGYLYAIKASALDVAIRRGFNQTIKGHPEIKVVAEGETFFTPANALKATQTMIQAKPDMNAIIASDQGITGATQALGSRSSGFLLVGYGGGAVALKAIKAGKWYGTVAQVPATTGRLAMECAIRAVRTGKGCGSHDPAAKLPNKSIVTKANVNLFKAEWPG
jgi:ribose transport system substrate-binding protein